MSSSVLLGAFGTSRVIIHRAAFTICAISTFLRSRWSLSHQWGLQLPEVFKPLVLLFFRAILGWIKFILLNIFKEVLELYFGFLLRLIIAWFWVWFGGTHFLNFFRLIWYLRKRLDYFILLYENVFFLRLLNLLWNVIDSFFKTIKT